MSAARLLLQVLHTDVCQQNILLQNTDVLIMNNVFEFFMEPNEQVRSGYKTHTPTCTDLFEQLMLAIHFLQNDAGNDITISSHNKFLNILIQSMAFHHGELQEARSSASHSSQSAGEPGCSAGEKTHTHTHTHLFSGAKEDYHFLFFRRCCSLAGWRSFLWTMTFTWARTQTLMLCDRSTCTESSDLDLSRDWTGF